MLRTGAGLAGTGALASLTGCLSDVLPGDGGLVDGGAGASVSAADWVPAPSTYGDRDHARWGVLRPADLAPHADALGEDFYEVLVSGYADGLLGLDPTDVRTHVVTGGGSVFEAGFDGDAVSEALSDDGFSEAGTHEGFDVWRSGADAVAVGDDVLVVGSREDDPVAGMEAVVDAGTGASERYREASDAADQLFSRLTDGQLRGGTTRDPPETPVPSYGRFAGLTGRGYAVDVDDGESTVRMVFTFESADDADSDAVEEMFQGTGLGHSFGDVTDVEAAADGAVVTLSATVPTGDVALSGLGSRFRSGRPTLESNIQAGATIDVDDAGDEVRVVWTSNLNAEYLTVQFVPEAGAAVQKRLDDVGQSAYYEGADGETLDVVVAAHADGRLTVIQDETVEL